MKSMMLKFYYFCKHGISGCHEKDMIISKGKGECTKCGRTYFSFFNY